MNLPEAAQLVPHADEALLLECIDTVEPDGLVASLTVRGWRLINSPNGSIPSWVGAEIMAQAISAFATYRAGRPYQPKLGLLLGVRHYRAQVLEMPFGARVCVRVRESTRDEAGRAVFDSTISIDGSEVASAMLTVYQPDNVAAVLAEQLA